MNRITIAIAALSLVAGAAAAAAEKKSAPAALKPGVKTPGVQIPFANLVAEAEIKTAAQPEWLFFSASLYAPSGDTLLKVDAKTNKAGDPIAGLSKPCGGMVNAFGSLWSPQCGNGSLVRIDPKTMKVTATIASGVSHARASIVASADSVWLLTDDKTTLSRIDPEQNLVVGDIRLAAGCQNLVIADKSIFVACPSRNQVWRINPVTNIVDEVIKTGAQPIALAAGGDGVLWVLCRKEGKLDRIDTKTNKVVKTIDLEVPDADGSIAFGEGWLWVSQKGFPLARIDTKLETVVQQFSGAGIGGGAILTSPGALWLSTASGVSKIDPKRVLATIPAE